MTVRVVLVDDHEMVIEGLKAMLAPFSGRVEVVGEAVGADKAMAVVLDLQPDIVLCDVRMQGASGLDLCREIRERDPGRKVILLSVYDDEQYLFQAFRVGAAGYLLKSISSEELVRQLEFVHSGETAIDPGMAGQRPEPVRVEEAVRVPGLHPFEVEAVAVVEPERERKEAEPPLELVVDPPDDLLG